MMSFGSCIDNTQTYSSNHKEEVSKMAKTDESITLGKLAESLGVSAQYFTLHPEIKAWLAEQEGVVFEARRSAIPAGLVETVRKKFNVKPTARRVRKVKSADDDAFASLSIAELESRKAEADEIRTSIRSVLDRVERNTTLHTALKEASKEANANFASVERAIGVIHANKDREIAELEARLAELKSL